MTDDQLLAQQTLKDAFPDTRVIARWDYGDPPPSSYLITRPNPTPPRGPFNAVGPDGPKDWVELGAEGVKYGHEIKNGKPRYRTLCHTWAVCDKCGQGTMRKKGARPVACRITPGCPGKRRP
jgi:hypothetical protein